MVLSSIRNQEVDLMVKYLRRKKDVHRKRAIPACPASFTVDLETTGIQSIEQNSREELKRLSCFISRNNLAKERWEIMRSICFGKVDLCVSTDNYELCLKRLWNLLTGSWKIVLEKSIMKSLENG
ncbi:hypothetical protein NPIL_572251 [Nephila pilipes]|uniref:Uncharacterized protein n=1 Tax=Nephila pilipes TaxID=299642 RepID=A0A8X6NB53_NEPPI|nr:hypothetical protein NPIL_572251 [Nephila pilipes]